MQVVIGLLIIAATVFAVFRRIDVRLALLLAGLALGASAGLSPQLPGQAGFRVWSPGGPEAAGLGVLAVVRKFLETFSSEQFVVPICCAMGFAHVLRLTACDQHLVQALVKPLRRVQFFLLPGAVAVGFLVNIPVISQTSTAVAIGSVLVPLLLAARVSPLTTGAALVLGSSVGGELLNPGAPELLTVSKALGIETQAIVEQVLPLLLVQLVVSSLVFWALSLRAENRAQAEGIRDPEMEKKTEADSAFRVNWFKAAVPLLPLAILFLTGPPLQVLDVPRWWLDDAQNPQRFASRLIGAAMLVGAAVAALTSPRQALGAAKAFFEGAGYAFTHIVSLIVIASSFAEGIKRVGLADFIGHAAGSQPLLLILTGGLLPLAFAWLSGSGMAATQGLYEFFVVPARGLGLDPVQVGALVSIGSAAGRTMSPVAAVVLMSASLTGTNPVELIRRVAVPLLAGMAAVLLTAAIRMAV